MNLSAYTHRHTDTPTLAVHFGSPPSNRELQVRRVSANRKAGIEGVKRKHNKCKGRDGATALQGKDKSIHSHT